MAMIDHLVYRVKYEIALEAVREGSERIFYNRTNILISRIGVYLARSW
jgi:hypothetical protein